TSLYGSFTKWDAGDPNDPGSLNFMMCSSPNSPVRSGPNGNTSVTGNVIAVGQGVNTNFAVGPFSGCNYTFDVWAVGSRTVWNPVKNLDVGIDIMYTKLEQNMDPTRVLFNFGGGGNRAAGLYVPKDQDVVSAIVRIQRNFYP